MSNRRESERVVVGAPLTRWVWQAVSIGVAYLTLFLLLYPYIGPIVGALGVLPVGVTGALAGSFGGLVAGLVVIPLQAGLYTLLGDDGLLILQHSLLGQALLLVTGPAVGWVVKQRISTERTLMDSEARLRLLIDQLPAVIWTTDRELIITSAKSGRLDAVHAVQDRLVGRPLADLLQTDDPEHPAVAAHERALLGQSACYSLALPDRVLQCHVQPFTGHDGKVIGSIGIALDTTARRQAEEALRESEARFRSAFDHVVTGMALVGLDGGWLQVNRSLCRILGYSPELFLSTSILQMTHADDRKRLSLMMPRLISGELPSLVLEQRYLHKQGQVVWAQLSLAVVRDANEQPLYLIAQLQDITDRQRFEEQLVRLADHDPLTELYNRRRFQLELQRRLLESQAAETEGAVLFLDLDGFKYVNDTLGHQAGDELLKSVAILLSEQVGQQGVVARLGGDEFAVLLSPADALAAGAMAEQIRDSVRKHTVVVGGQPVVLSASTGMVLYPEHGMTAQKLLACADMAMYRAKEMGRNRVHIYAVDDEERDRMQSKLTWEQRIREALEQDRFVLHAQPILDLARDRITHYELLLRMRGPNGEIYPPQAFLAVAERFGLIFAVDRWVVSKALGLLRQLQEAGNGCALAVNLSGRTFTDPELLPWLQAEIKASGVNPAQLVLEITETAAITDTNQAAKFLGALKQIGCRFALDDFGAGFSSFSTLRSLSVDYLKIDGSFVHNLSHDRVNQHLVRAMASMAQGLGKQTIAECVEDEMQLQFLRACGISHAQGYLIGRPLDTELVFAPSGNRVIPLPSRV